MAFVMFLSGALAAFHYQKIRSIIGKNLKCDFPDFTVGSYTSKWQPFNKHWPIQGRLKRDAPQNNLAVTYMSASAVLVHF